MRGQYAYQMRAQYAYQMWGHRKGGGSNVSPPTRETLSWRETFFFRKVISAQQKLLLLAPLLFRWRETQHRRNCIYWCDSLQAVHEHMIGVALVKYGRQNPPRSERAFQRPSLRYTMTLSDIQWPYESSKLGMTKRSSRSRSTRVLSGT